jgi:short chain dehydrogenase
MQCRLSWSRVPVAGFEFARQYLANGWHAHAACRDPASAPELRQLAGVAARDFGSWQWMSRTRKASKRRLRNSRGKPLTSFSTMPASEELGVKPSETSTTPPGRRCSTSTPWGPCGYQRAFLDHVARSDRKLIVTLTSGMGSIADNSSGGSIAYRSSKAAVNMVMCSLAIDLAPRNITCVVINPGWVQTEMGGPHATLTPAESVTRLRRLIDTLGPAQSGKFFNHDGRCLQMSAWCQ